MTFPTTSVLDNFNRANGDPGTNWTFPVGNQGGLKFTIDTNQAAFPDSTNEGYWNVSTYGPDCEVYTGLPTVAGSDFEMYMRVASPGGSFNCYALKWNSVFQRLNYFRVDSGVFTQLGANDDSVAGPVSGDSVGAEINGTTLTAHIKQGGTWAAYATRTDSTYSAAGYLGWYDNSSTLRGDNFGGGTIGGVTATNVLAWIGAAG